MAGAEEADPMVAAGSVQSFEIADGPKGCTETPRWSRQRRRAAAIPALKVVAATALTIVAFAVVTFIAVRVSRQQQIPQLLKDRLDRQDGEIRDNMRELASLKDRLDRLGRLDREIQALEKRVEILEGDMVGVNMSQKILEHHNLQENEEDLSYADFYAPYSTTSDPTASTTTSPPPPIPTSDADVLESARTLAEEDPLANFTGAIRNIEAVLLASTVQLPRNCEDYASKGVMESGFRIIDVDGLGGLKPIWAYCEVAENGEVTTNLHHDSMGTIEVGVCQTEDCFRRDIAYNGATLEHARTLIHLSASCSQEIKFHCLRSQLLDFGHWYDWAGQRQTYFNGANYGKQVCGCSEDGSCLFSAKGRHCNCDTPSHNKVLTDTGKVTNSSALPIRAVTYGPLLNGTEATFDIGSLKCRGIAHYGQPYSSCKTLKMSGEYVSGLYTVIDEKGIPTEVFCNFSAPLYSNDLEVSIRPVSLETALLSVEVTFSCYGSGNEGSVCDASRSLVHITKGGASFDNGTMTVPRNSTYRLGLSVKEYYFRDSHGSGRVAYANLYREQTGAARQDVLSVTGSGNLNSTIVSLSSEDALDLEVTRGSQSYNRGTVRVTLQETISDAERILASLRENKYGG